MIFRTEEEFDPALDEFAKVFSKIPRRRPTNPSMPTLTTLRACAVEKVCDDTARRKTVAHRSNDMCHGKTVRVPRSRGKFF
jgi:hypothetical protein